MIKYIIIYSVILINDINYSFYIDLLDSIHVYFMHSYKMGFRIPNDFYVEDDDSNDDVDCKQEQDSNTLNFIDEQLEKLQSHIQDKKKEFYKIRGISRKDNSNNKFSTTITTENTLNTQIIKKSSLDLLNNWLTKNGMITNHLQQFSLFLSDNDYDNHDNHDNHDNSNQSNIFKYFIKSKIPRKQFDAIKAYIDDDKNDHNNNDENKSDNNEYGFGVRFYYWNYFKINNDLYVENRYKNLKTELLQNKFSLQHYNKT